MTEKTVDGITYTLQEVDGGKKIAIISKALPPENSDRHVIVPQYIDWHEVIGAKNGAFSSRKNNWIQEISFLSGIRFFGGHSFFDLWNLKRVNFCIAQDTPLFGANCFENCENLACLYFADHKKVGESHIVRRQKGCYDEVEKSLILSALQKSNRLAFRGCWKMPTVLAEH